MAWWNKQESELPERLRGKKPEEIDAALAELDTVKTQLAAKDTEIQTVKTEADQVKARVAELEANATRQPTRQEETPPERKGPTSVLIDEDAAFNERMAPAVNLALHSSAMTARIVAQQTANKTPEDRKIWSKYESEIDDLMSKEPPQRRAFPQVWLNALTYVKGVHMKDILKLQSEGNDFFAEQVSSQGAQHETPDVEDKLTAEELEIAKNMRIKPEEMLAQKKAWAGGGRSLTVNLPERS